MLLLKNIVVLLLVACCGYVLVIKNFNVNKILAIGKNLQLVDRWSNAANVLCLLIALKIDKQYFPATTRQNVALEWALLVGVTMFYLVQAVAHINRCVTGDDPIGQIGAAFEVADDIAALLLLAIGAVNGVGFTVLRRSDEQLNPISHLILLHGGFAISFLMRLQEVLICINSVEIWLAYQDGTVVTLCFPMFQVLHLEVLLYIYRHVQIELRG